MAAVDVGGTAAKAVLLDQDLRVLARAHQPTERTGPGAVAEQVGRLVEELAGRAGTDPVGIGVVVPGIVDDQAGVARYSANLGWRDVPFAALLRGRLDLPVAFGHDVTACGLAEWELGAGRGHRTVAVVPVGTGIAAALLLDGRPYRAGGYAGELGHVDIGHDLRCGCGATGCLEAVASAAALTRRYRERAGRPAHAADAAEVVRSAWAGDPHAAAVLADAVDGLARGLRLLTMLLAPEVVVLGGGLFEAGATLLDAVRDRLAELVTFQPMPRLRLAELGAEAGCLGAGLLAWRAVAGESP
ncbi:glucokinase [Amycolatopsis arida]|uniref:Glucokinase n=1 Tax=Amycolatopsis arida TaxID=587909 RepID=A0A1I5LKH0_9PSEU|nr:glucokinase [Amycolatopsis arida]SFO97637.1 glucokinase [Amycolatopsis arida]